MSSQFVLPSPGGALEDLVRNLTPPGARTWQSFGTDLPWILPPGVTMHSRNKPSREALERVLAEQRVPKAGWGYILDGPINPLAVESPSELHRNHGYAARSITAAAELDISGFPIAEIAERLDLHDLVWSGEAYESRGGRRYVARGRRLLVAFGVWPWAAVVPGRYRRWWTTPEAAEALAYWHDRAWIDAAHDLAATARYRIGGSNRRAISIEEHHACERFRDDLRRLDAASLGVD